MQSAGSSRAGIAWARVRDSLWFIPSVSVAIGTSLAMIAVQIPTPETDNHLARVWLFGGGAEGARGVLTAIAGSLITVTGTIFSVTIIALQLASSQFTPRVLGSFVADRVNQLVLGVFIGTFTYTLLVLRTIRSDADDRAALVPHVGVTIALVLLLVSVAALIVFINHAARSMQISVILHRETRRVLQHAETLLTVGRGEPHPTPIAADGVATAAAVRAVTAGYVQAVNVDMLWEAGRRAADPVMIQLDVRIGAFVLPGTVLARLSPSVAAAGDGIADAVRDAFVIGSDRTPEQDLEFGLVEIADIAVRALSPSINDPTTARHCIDRLTEILSAIGPRLQATAMLTSEDGGTRVIVCGTSYERALGIAFDQIVHFGASNPALVRTLLAALGSLGRGAPAHGRSALEAQVGRVAGAARRRLGDDELGDVERLVAATLETIRRGGDAPEALR